MSSAPNFPRLVTEEDKAGSGSQAPGVSPSLSGGGGGGTSDDMEHRVRALEDGFKELRASLKEIRDAQHSAALDASNKSGELAKQLAEINGSLKVSNEAAGGIRRDVDKLPSKFDVVVVMITVIGGLGATAVLIKTVWPFLSKAIGP